MAILFREGGSGKPHDFQFRRHDINGRPLKRPVPGVCDLNTDRSVSQSRTTTVHSREVVPISSLHHRLRACQVWIPRSGSTASGPQSRPPGRVFGEAQLISLSQRSFIYFQLGDP